MLEVLNRPTIAEALRHSLTKRSQPDANNGTGGEERWMMSGVSWDDYQALDSALGEDRSEPRLYFLDGELEILTTSLLHERLALLERCLATDTWRGARQAFRRGLKQK